MPQTDEGQFELTLGNKELLSTLFVMVVLLGIFFGMGYVVGRSSTPVDAAKGTAEPYVATQARSAIGSQRAETQASAADESAASAPQNTIITEAAAESGPVPVAATAAASRPSPVAQRPVEVSPVSIAQPQPGQMFLQVSAIARPEAEILTELLSKKGFRAIVAAGPTEKVFRVLVGPAKDTTEVAKLRSDLEAAGFKSIPRKY